ncbi:MAG: acyl--CoA ligase, partial [Gammaproteobacteria bacterium]|nr:acyl--CoA ligase [Gammaproteobacteria bacterium]
MPVTLEKLIDHHGRYRRDHIAVVFGQQRLSWAQFNSHVNQLANALQSSGIGKGDKVATVLPNSLDLLSIYWATISIGAVLVPLSPLLKPSGLINLLINADVRIVFLTTDLMTGLQQRRAEIEKISKEHYLTLGDDAGSKFNRYEDFIAASPDGSPNYPDMKQTDLFNIVYSSGTTGLPKGIMHSHLVRANYASHFAASFRMTPESVVLHTGSIVFNGAFVTLLPCFFLGARY